MGHLWFNCSCGSTLLVKKGKYPWYSPEKFLSEEAKGIFNTLGNLKSLPHIPNSVMQLQQTLADPEVSARDIANHLKTEPLMATQLLKMAENMRKSRNPQNPPIISLEHAIVYMGIKSVKDLVVAASLRTFKIPPSKFSVDDYWNESFLTGAITEYIAKKFSIALPEDQLFLAGSLCNVGKLVLATCFPPLINKIISDINSLETLSTWQVTEQKYKFPSHAILGEIAAALWGLPDFVMQSARKHHERYISKGAQIELWEVVGVANQFSHWLLLQPHRMDQMTVEDFMNRFKLREKDVENLVKEMEPLKNHVLNSRIAS
jgi:HD-like signal output (HDOD) protein